MSMRPALASLLVLGLALGSACKDDDDDPPQDGGSTDLGPKDIGVDTGADAVADGGADTGADAGEDAGEEIDGGMDDLGRADAGQGGPGVVFRVFDVDGDPVSGASITVDGATHTTDAEGVAFIPNLAGEQLFVVSQAGFETTPFAYDIPATARVQIDATLLPMIPFGTYDDSMLQIFGGGGGVVQMTADALETEAGVDITGTYEARLSTIDMSDPAQALAAPLPFVGRDLQGTLHALEAFTVLQIEVMQNGTPLRVKAGAQNAFDLTIPDAFADLVQVNDVVPAWSYDEASGLWVEEMNGTIQQSAFGGAKLWSGSFTHFSWWAIARPFEGACLEARSSGAGLPVGGALVRAIGIDHGYVAARFSDASGDACLEIKPGGNVNVSAIHESYASLATPVVATGNLTPGACGGGTCSQAPITLEGPACASGVVLDGQGAAYANARVQLRYQNGSGQPVSSFTNTDAQGGYCALGAGDGTVVASDATFSDSATIALPREEAICGGNCGSVPDLILADFVGGCVHGNAVIYQGMGNPLMQAPEGTPVYVYSGSTLMPDCDPGMDDPATWGMLEHVTTVGANGEFCASAIPLGPMIVLLGDCTTWPGQGCGPVQESSPLTELAVCGQPGCFDIGTVRFNMICDGGS